eukprot:TRINITY_DN40554_c0_g1_i1.p1 TRINITY_DN40554_c0_g1~~TRINITY_DN40554_c0_g1_i1.p1  ORF type:complete len:507 (-),score=77.77 TRINITY_DN40554_c0_g1_i1:298-1818(-)
MSQAEFPRLLGNHRNACHSHVGSDCKSSYRKSNASLKQPVTIAMFNVDMIGHVNPTFALVQELVKRGCKVHYFLPRVESFCAAARAAGAIVEDYLPDAPSDFKLETCGNFDGCKSPNDRYAIWSLASTLRTGDHIISRCHALGVRAVVYDPMAPHGLLVARKLGVPSVALLTFPGMGSIADLLQDEEQLDHWIKLRAPLAREVEERFGIDMQGAMLSRLQWLSDDDNFVNTSEGLTAPLPPPGKVAWADEVRAHFHFSPIGCMANIGAPHVTGSTVSKSDSAAPAALITDLPTEKLTAAMSRGAKIVYAALGTMALKDRWDIDIGGMSAGNVPPGVTGKEFCQHIWRSLFRAMEDLGDEYECVVSVGLRADALDFLGAGGLAAVPDNVSVCSFVQQLEMLSNYADAFISHAGFNSMQESLIAGVPLIAVPQAIDQPANASKIEASGWGKAFLQPMSSVSAPALVAAIREVTRNDSPYKKAVELANRELRDGEVKAADRLLGMILTR